MNQDAQIKDVSDTALWVGVYRCLESRRPDAIFRDPWAEKLVGERGHRIASSMKALRFMGWVMALRTAAIDRLIESALQEGVDTILNLGAGLDTRPYRMRLPSHLRWIEIDFANMIEHKERILKGATASCKIERIALDLSRPELYAADFARIGKESKKVLILTEGFLSYMTTEQVADIANALFSSQSYHFWIQDFHRGGANHAFAKRLGKKFAASPYQFKVADWFAFFEEHGWKAKQIIWREEEARRLGRRPPLLFPYFPDLFRAWLPSSTREKARTQFGYVLMERAAPIASSH